MKVAYILNVHRNPQLLSRTILTLSTSKSAFFIHVDLKASLSDFVHVRSDNVFLSKPRTPVYWGEFSQVAVTLQLMRQALESSIGCRYLVFLQGSDYPLRSGQYIENYLKRNAGYEYINAVKMPAAGYPLSKINTLRYPSETPIRKFMTRVLTKISLGRRDYRKHLNGLDAFAGQAYWTLTREACEYVIDFVDANKHVVDYFRNTFTADEMFFHTILGNSSFASRFRRGLTFIEHQVDGKWSGSEGSRHRITSKHIALFDAQDQVLIEDEWGSGEVLFARKFGDDDLQLVDRIDAMIRRKEGSLITGG
jgi:Core-2/I-Branching enzyme